MCSHPLGSRVARLEQGCGRGGGDGTQDGGGGCDGGEGVRAASVLKSVDPNPADEEKGSPPLPPPPERDEKPPMEELNGSAPKLAAEGVT